MSKYLKEIETNPSQMLKKKKKTLKNEKKYMFLTLLYNGTKHVQK